MRLLFLLWSKSIMIVTMALWQTQIVIGGGDDRCRRKCGDVIVPYPFGFTADGEDCYLSTYNNFTCNETYNPPRVYWRYFQVIDISLELSEIRVFGPISFDCYSSTKPKSTYTFASSLLGNPRFSYTKNVYTAIGCDTYAYLRSFIGPKYTTGCLSICENKESVLEGTSCSGMGCCQTSIPPGLKHYQTAFRSDSNHTSILDFNPCSYAFLVEKDSYTFKKNDLTYMTRTRFPIVIDWSVGNRSCEEATKEPNYACVSKNSYCKNSIYNGSYICKCSSGYAGNPYVDDEDGSCRDIDECMHPESYRCNGTCTNTLGSYNCTCPVGTIGDPRTYGCVPVPRNSQIRLVILIPVVVLSSLGAIALSVYIYAQIQRRKLIELRHMYFLQNGGAILEKQISARNGMQKIFRIYTMDEIEKATDKFDESRILGRGGQGVVYKGTFSGDNSTTYAIKKSLSLDGSKVEGFINEIIILSQINHRNVVKLVGCCLEEENPLLIYEFVPNGTLLQKLHSGSIPWDVRLNIGVDTAGALGYLHSSANTPIIHGDVKSSNVLLEDDYTAKVSDFGASRLIPVDETQVNTIVKGTLGYLDPEYIQTHELTDKSDVYSFGVVLAELLTGKRPVSSGREGERRTLATYFLSCMRDGSIREILDDRVAIEGSFREEMMEVASIAKRCLSLRGEDRPSMLEISMELQRLRRVESHPWHPQEDMKYIDIDPNMQKSAEISLLSLTTSGR